MKDQSTRIAKKITIVDSGVANLLSVVSALKRLDIDAEITSDAQTIRRSSHVILPGVGAAAAAMAHLQSRNLIDTLRDLTQPVLGICLGMQLLFRHSDEGVGVDTIGLIQGDITHLPALPDMPVPHMGWNQINIHSSSHPLLRGIAENSYVYFVHSLAAAVDDYTLATCRYSKNFTAIAGYKNFFGCQFHPERSGAVGQQILKNFLDI